MLKKVLSLIMIVNMSLAMPIMAQNTLAHHDTEEQIQIALQAAKAKYKVHEPTKLLIYALALAATSSIVSNAHAVNKAQRFIADKRLIKNNPPQALAKKADALTKSFNRMAKGNKSYTALSKDINLLNKQLQIFAEHANSFPKGSGFTHIPPDLYPQINKVLSSIPKNLLRANPNMRYSIKGIQSILTQSVEKMAAKGFAMSAIGVTLIAMLPQEVYSSQISTTRISVKRALEEAYQEGPEYLTLTALALSEGNEKMLVNVLSESAKAGEDIYPVISAQLAIMSAPETVSTVKGLIEQAQDQSIESARTDLIKALKDKDNQFKVNFSF